MPSRDQGRRRPGRAARIVAVAVAVAVAAVLGVLTLPALVAVGMPARVRIPRSAAARAFAPPTQAQFSHPAHEPLRCFQCHPGLFPQARVAFVHADMDRGHYCGGCHDGKRAQPIGKFACQDCHAP